MNVSLSSPRVPTAGSTTAEPVIVFENVRMGFDEGEILHGISFQVAPRETLVLVGETGAGKTLLLKLAAGLLRPSAGRVRVLGHEVSAMSEQELLDFRRQIGFVFQEGALFDSLTVAENVGYKLYEETDLPLEAVRRRVEEVLGFIGLGEYIDRMPSELSGGQRRRVAIARAMAAKPGIILYDEATTGLDPITAITVDEEIIKLRDFEEVTSIVVTHQLRDAFYVATHEAVREGARVGIVPADEQKCDEAEFIMLREGLVAFEGNASELRASKDPYLKTFLS